MFVLFQYGRHVLSTSWLKIEIMDLIWSTVAMCIVVKWFIAIQSIGSVRDNRIVVLVLTRVAECVRADVSPM